MSPGLFHSKEMCLTNLSIIQNNDYVQTFAQKIMTLTISFNNLKDMAYRLQSMAYTELCFLHTTV